MVSNENNEEMSVNDILSSIKEVISSEQDMSKTSDDNEFIELTDVVDGKDESILLEDVVDLNNETLSNNRAENKEKNSNLKLDNSNFISDLSIDDILRETIKETLNDWFAKNLKTIVESTVKTNAKTGVEMEALTAVTISCLTIYDMCKYLNKKIKIQNIHLVSKTGGKSNI